MQRRAVEALEAVRVEDEAHSASEEHSSQASVRRSVDETEPLRPAALRAAFLTLDTIVARAVEEASFCYEERATLPQGTILQCLTVGIGGSSVGGRHSA